MQHPHATAEPCYLHGCCNKGMATLWRPCLNVMVTLAQPLLSSQVALLRLGQFALVVLDLLTVPGLQVLIAVVEQHAGLLCHPPLVLQEGLLLLHQGCAGLQVPCQCLHVIDHSGAMSPVGPQQQCT